MQSFSTLVSQRASHYDALLNCESQFNDAVDLIVRSILKNRKLLLCGNGGSAADAQHIAAEFVGRFKLDRRALPAIALTTDSSALTAIANDWSYDYVFKRQLEALGQMGDTLLAISTSGRSRNVLEAIGYARSINMSVIGLVGHDGGSFNGNCDVVLNVGGDLTPIIQERQLMIEHMICEAVDISLQGYGVV